jgi:WhiB family redox-sensing transcriptional regulator
VEDLDALLAFCRLDEPPVRSILARWRQLRPAWMRDALCAEYPREWWFPERGASTEPAKAICAKCLVRAECLDYAMGNFEARTFGVWGGLSAAERRALPRTAAPSSARTHCEQGHPLERYEYRGRVLVRCRVCRAERRREEYRRRRADQATA